MRRVSKKFEVSNCNLYKYHRRQFMTIPKHMIVKYYLYDEDQRIYIGVLKRKTYFIELVLVLCIIANIVFLSDHKAQKHIVNVPNTMY